MIGAYFPRYQNRELMANQGNFGVAPGAEMVPDEMLKRVIMDRLFRR
jgi:hypothetical protein